MEGDTTELPNFYRRKIQKKLGPFWEMLPPGAVMHDHHAYLHSQSPSIILPLPIKRLPAVAEATV